MNRQGAGKNRAQPTGAVLRAAPRKLCLQGTHGWKLAYAGSSGNGETFMIALTRARALLSDLRVFGLSRSFSGRRSGCRKPLSTSRSGRASTASADLGSIGLDAAGSDIVWLARKGTTEWVWLPPLETTQGLEVNAVPRSALYTLGPYGSLISILESYDRARMQSIHGAESCFQRADESLREVRWLLPPARHGGKERRSGAGMGWPPSRILRDTTQSIDTTLRLLRTRARSERFVRFARAAEQGTMAGNAFS